MKTLLRKLFYQPKPRRKPQSYRPQMEGLEERTLMAGDVTAYISGSTLHIQGDDANNNIEIFRQSNGSVRIENTESTPTTSYSSSGGYYSGYYSGGSRLFNNYYTLIDGAHSETISGSFNYIKIAMKGGNDSVTIRDINVPWDLDVNMGSGGDKLTIKNVNAGDDMWLSTGGGGTSSYRDVIDISALPRRLLLIEQQ